MAVLFNGAMAVPDGGVCTGAYRGVAAPVPGEQCANRTFTECD